MYRNAKYNAKYKDVIRRDAGPRINIKTVLKNDTDFLFITKDALGQ